LFRLYPQTRKDLDEYHKKHGGRFDAEVLEYIGPIEFYLDMKLFLTELEKLEMPLCYPKISQAKQIEISDARDISLLISMKSGIVPNDVDFSAKERFYLLTGANGGGKTTFLRSLGICLALFSSGLPIPATSASIYPFTRLFTHFPADETLDVSRMMNEKAMAEEIVRDADGDSVVLLNETFSSTNEANALNESVNLIRKLHKKSVFGIFVTHQHGLSEYEDALSECGVGYLEAVVIHDEENTRTFKIVKKQPDKKSYAKDILEKYGLTKEQLREKLLGTAAE